MPKAPSLDIRPEHLSIVQAILRKRVPECEVRAFGSRVAGKTKPYSDLDLAVMTKERLPLSRLADLADDFTESDLPWKVDVADWAGIDENFRRIIEENYIVIQEAAPAS